jgi:hypothetical protein
VYDPDKGGEWPENPRPFVEIGHGQIRPIQICADDRYLWCVTNAEYGTYGGALSRIDPATGACKVWRHLLPDHNPTSLVLDSAHGRIYGGTTVWPDQRSAPAAKGPAGVFAFDTAREKVVWTAQPVEKAEWFFVLTEYKGLVIAETGGRLILLRPEDGAVERIIDANLAHTDPGSDLFVGGDGELYLASPEGLHRYDLDRGRGECVIDGPVSLPRVRGADLLFIREYDVGIAEGLWKA